MESINLRARNKWTPEEDAKLCGLFDSGHTWAEISEATGRSEQGCKQRLRNLRGTCAPPQGFEPWTAQEERVLRKAFEQCQGRKGWPEQASRELVNRSPKACHRQSLLMRRRGRWKPYEAPPAPVKEDELTQCICILGDEIARIERQGKAATQAMRRIRTVYYSLVRADKLRLKREDAKDAPPGIYVN